jgi:cobalamin biosynthesis protein CbiG
MRGDKKLELFHHSSKTIVAIGLGCKRGCSREAIVALVERAIAAASCAGAPAALFTHEAKKSEAGLAGVPRRRYKNA